MNTVSRHWRAALILVAIVAVYANSLRGPFVLDDQASVVQNAEIRDLGRLDRVLTPLPDSPVAGRPLVNLSFAIDYAIGGLKVPGYHVANLAWHIACAWLLFGIVRRTMELPAIGGQAAAGLRTRAMTRAMSADDVALAAALLWAVHPLASEVVDYITQRTESMMAFCLLLSLYAAMRAHGSSRRRWTAIAVLSCLAGTVCKETIAVAPLLIALHDRVFVFGSWREAAAARRTLYLGLAATWVVLAGLVRSGPRAAVTGLDAGVSAWTYLLNQAVVVVDYLRLTVWPSKLVVFYGWPEALSLGDVWPYAAGVVVLLAVTAVALVKAPALGYLGAWFFITLAPTSSIIPIATEVGAERRMYLPLMALAVLAVMAGDALAARVRGHERWRRVAASVALAAVVVALGSATVRRNTEYASPIVLAQTVVERRPTAVAHHILGEQLALAGRNVEAEAALRRAVSLGNSRARYQLGMLLLDAQRAADAAEQFDAFVATAGARQRLRWLEPPLLDVLTARLMLARIHAAQGGWSDVAAQARQVLGVVPRHPEAQRLLGAALFNTQQWAAAVATLREYLATRPGDVRARIDLGVALVAMERLDEAVAEFRRATETDPADPDARRLLNLALADQRALRQ